jgi:hypothetical protein
MKYSYEISIIQSSREYMSFGVVTEYELQEDGIIYRHKINEINEIMKDIETFKLKQPKISDSLKAFESDYMKSIIRTYDWIINNHPELML